MKRFLCCPPKASTKRSSTRGMKKKNTSCSAIIFVCLHPRHNVFFYIVSTTGGTGTIVKWNGFQHHIHPRAYLLHGPSVCFAPCQELSTPLQTSVDAMQTKSLIRDDASYKFSSYRRAVNGWGWRKCTQKGPEKFTAISTHSLAHSHIQQEQEQKQEQGLVSVNSTPLRSGPTAQETKLFIEFIENLH